MLQDVTALIYLILSYLILSYLHFTLFILIAIQTRRQCSFSINLNISFFLTADKEIVKIETKITIVKEITVKATSFITQTVTTLDGKILQTNTFEEKMPVKTEYLEEESSPTETYETYCTETHANKKKDNLRSKKPSLEMKRPSAPHHRALRHLCIQTEEPKCVPKPSEEPPINQDTERRTRSSSRERSTNVSSHSDETRVFARWPADDHYYPGKIVKEMNNNT